MVSFRVAGYRRAGDDEAMDAFAAQLVDRHGLKTSKGTIQVRKADAVSMSDDDLVALADLSLGAPAGT